MQPIDHLGSAIHAAAPRLPVEAVGVWVTALRPPMVSSGIVTPRRIAAFVGQVAEESEGFAVMQEDLYYSAARLCEVWPSRFPDLAAAEPFAMNPQALADKVYAGRMGNDAAGDGWRFRGEGLIQLTGKDAYAEFARSCGKTVDDVAAWLLTPPGAAASACWYWVSRSLNPLADAWDLEEITRRINGGLAGIETRKALCNAALAAVG